MGIQVIARTTGSGDGGTVSLSQPTHVAGDLLVVLVNVAELATAPSAVTSGWILIDRDTFTGGQIMAFARVATSTSDPLSFTPGNEKWAYRAYSIRGHGITNVLDLAPGFLSGSSTSCNYATKANLVSSTTYLSLVASAGEAGDVVAASAPTGWSQFAKVSTGNTSSNAAIATSERIVTGVTTLVPPATAMEDNGVFGTYHITIPEKIYGNLAAILAGHKARWDFSSPANYTLNGANQVISAADLSGTGATINSEGLPVIEAINGVGAVRFNGAQSMNGNGPAVISQPYTIWAVVQMMANSGGSDAFVGHVRGVLKTQSGTFRSAGSASTVDSGVAADTQPHIVIGTFDGTTSQIYVDGATADATGTHTVETLNINYLGRNGWGGEWANARIGEAGIIPGTLAAGDLTLLHTYLNNKWMNVTVPPPTGGVTGAFVFGAAVAEGRRASAGAVSGAFVFGAAIADGRRASKGTVTGAFTFGAAVATGSTPRRGGVTGAFTFGPAVVEGDSPPNRGGVTGAFTFGAAVASGAADSDGGVTGAFEFGPAVASGSAAEAVPEGGATGAISWSASGGTGSYSAYRFQVIETRGTNPNGITQASEFQVLIDGVNQTPFAVYGVGMNMPPSEGMANLGDGDTATKWLNFNYTDGYPFLYFMAPIAANGFRIATANDSPERDPVRFEVYGSNDATPFWEGTWTLLSSEVLDPGADPPIGRFQYSADYPLPVGGGFDGRAAARGDASGTVDFGPATTGGDRASSGGVTGGFTFGAAVAEGRSVRRGAAAGAFVFGPTAATGARVSRGNVVGSFLFGPTAANGAAAARGNVAGSFLFGPAVVDGTVPTIPIPTGGATGSFQFGAAVADGRRTSRGAVSSAFTFGPTTAAGAAASRGGVSGGFVFGPTTADGRRVSRGGVTGAFVFGPTTSVGRVTARGNVAAAFQFGPAVADGGEFPGVGGISGSFQFGPAVVEGEMPSKGGFTGGFTFGAAEVGGVSASGGSAVGTITFGSATASGTRRSAGLASGSLTYGPAAVEGRTQRRGGFAGSISWGVPQWDGGRDSEGDATGAISWGPGAAEGLSSNGGGISGAITFGPAVTGGNAAARGEFTGSITYGPGVSGGTARALGEVEGAYGWGVPQWDGYAPARGGADGAYEFGPAEIDASAALAGGAFGTILWGPARAEGGNFEQPLCWPGTITLVPRWPGWALGSDSVVVSVVADGPSVLLLEDGPAVTLAASGLSVALTSDGPGIVLASDGPNVVLIPEDAC